MNTFRRTDGQTVEEVDAMLKKCRTIGWGVLGSLEEKQVKELSVWKEDKERPAEIWAIGHW